MLLAYITKRDKEGYRKAVRQHLKHYWEFIYNYNENDVS